MPPRMAVDAAMGIHTTRDTLPTLAIRMAEATVGRLMVLVTMKDVAMDILMTLVIHMVEATVGKLMVVTVVTVVTIKDVAMGIIMTLVILMAPVIRKETVTPMVVFIHIEPVELMVAFDL